MDKKSVKNVFVVLVYRNTEDIIALLKSMQSNVSDYQVIIVNNFYDEETKLQFETIAENYKCDIIHCENRGYGAGNNEGIRFAMKHYEFECLIISNPDIVIKKFPQEILQKYNDGVIGGMIYNLSGTKQNPMLSKNSFFVNSMIYKGLKHDSKIDMFLGKAVNKIGRIWAQSGANVRKKERRKVYQIHGSFLILARSVIEKIGAPYDEAMFLFGEEGYLAYLLDKEKIPTYYCPEIEVLHKEDGSMKFRNDINEECKKASIYFFEKYYFHTEE